MVVGTHIEDGVVLAVVPADELIVLTGEGEEAIGGTLCLAPFLHLSQQPGTRDDSMSLEKFQSCRGPHLAGDHTLKIALHRQLVDGAHLTFLYYEVECPQESLRLLALPVEVDSNGDIGDGEGGRVDMGMEDQLTVKVALPADGTVGKANHLGASDVGALGLIGGIQCEVHLTATHDTHRDRGLMVQRQRMTEVAGLGCRILDFVHNRCYFVVRQSHFADDGRGLRGCDS